MQKPQLAGKKSEQPQQDKPKAPARPFGISEIDKALAERKGDPDAKRFARKIMRDAFNGMIRRQQKDMPVVDEAELEIAGKPALEALTKTRQGLLDMIEEILNSAGETRSSQWARFDLLVHDLAPQLRIASAILEGQPLHPKYKERFPRKPDPTALARAAVLYGRMGLQVFPCKPKDKVPLSQHGYHDATSNEEHIAGCWRDNPNANIGLALAPSGLCAIDVDRHNGAMDGMTTMNDLQLKLGYLPPTCEAATGGAASTCCSGIRAAGWSGASGQAST
jgi:hypothetical protein